MDYAVKHKKMKKAIIIANGDSPTKSQINFLKNKGYDNIICADGGANSAKKLGIIPDLIIGDLDSITAQNKDYYSGKCKITLIRRQNDTDVEKALKFLIKNKFSEVILLGATGDRLDHSICNLGIVLKFHNKINISILHKKSILRAYKGKIELPAVRCEIISFYGFNARTKITSKGLKFPLNNMALPFGKRESTSNVATRNKVSLEIKGGIIFVIRDFNMLKKNDLV